MDFLQSPKALFLAAIVAMSSAFINTGSFVYVNETVQENKTDIAVHAEQLVQMKSTQTEIKGYTKDTHQWVQQQIGAERERNRINDSE